MNKKIKDKITKNITTSHYYITLNLDDILEPNEAKRIFKEFHKRIDRKLYGKEFINLPREERTHFSIIVTNEKNRSSVKILAHPKESKDFFFYNKAKEVWHKMSLANGFNEELLSKKEDYILESKPRGMIEKFWMKDTPRTDLAYSKIDNDEKLKEITKELEELSDESYFFTSDSFFN